MSVIDPFNQGDSPRRRFCAPMRGSLAGEGQYFDSSASSAALFRGDIGLRAAVVTGAVPDVETLTGALSMLCPKIEDESSGSDFFVAFFGLLSKATDRFRNKGSPVLDAGAAFVDSLVCLLVTPRIRVSS